MMLCVVCVTCLSVMQGCVAVDISSPLTICVTCLRCICSTGLCTLLGKKKQLNLIVLIVTWFDHLKLLRAGHFKLAIAGFYIIVIFSISPNPVCYRSQVVDLYWGIDSEEWDSPDLQRMRMKLLEECLKTSAGPCFVVGI